MNRETKVRARPAAIILTPGAEERIADLMSRAPDGAIGVKLSTPRRGCSGLAYSVDYVTDANPMDEKIETPGGTFYVDGGSDRSWIGARTISRLALYSKIRTPRVPAAAAKASPFSLTLV
jgi:iron-sulfur cluster assembly protein